MAKLSAVFNNAARCLAAGLVTGAVIAQVDQLSVTETIFEEIIDRPLFGSKADFISRSIRAIALRRDCGTCLTYRDLAAADAQSAPGFAYATLQRLNLVPGGRALLGVAKDLRYDHQNPILEKSCVTQALYFLAGGMVAYRADYEYDRDSRRLLGSLTHEIIHAHHFRHAPRYNRDNAQGAMVTLISEASAFAGEYLIRMQVDRAEKEGGFEHNEEDLKVAQLYWRDFLFSEKAKEVRRYYLSRREKHAAAILHDASGFTQEMLEHFTALPDGTSLLPPDVTLLAIQQQLRQESLEIIQNKMNPENENQIFKQKLCDHRHAQQKQSAQSVRAVPGSR